jgi:hypothetical protein
MSQIINFLATCDRFAFFGIAPDPAARVAEMQDACPLPIEVASGWIIDPRARLAVLDRVQREFRLSRAKGDWFEVERERAVAALAEQAQLAEGKGWRVRKHPLPPKPDTGQKMRAIITPHGQFSSVVGAAQALGMTRQAAWDRARRQTPGWRFADETVRPRVPRVTNVGRPVGAKTNLTPVTENWTRMTRDGVVFPNLGEIPKSMLRWLRPNGDTARFDSEHDATDPLLMTGAAAELVRRFQKSS